jgi:hypothetical protein
MTLAGLLLLDNNKKKGGGNHEVKLVNEIPSFQLSIN